jgi:hypothetical protein
VAAEDKILEKNKLNETHNNSFQKATEKISIIYNLNESDQEA